MQATEPGDEFPATKSGDKLATSLSVSCHASSDEIWIRRSHGLVWMQLGPDMRIFLTPAIAVAMRESLIALLNEWSD